MNKGQMKKLLREATSADCTDDRMQEVCSIVRCNRPWALKEIEKLKTRYCDTWSSPASTNQEIDVATVQNIQCTRLLAMLNGDTVPLRLTIEDVREMSVAQSP
jgi:hypothetical protein